MKVNRIEFSPQYVASPVSFWVHVHKDGGSWREATEFDPPLPKPVPGRGWPRLMVEFDGVELEFSSVHEVHHVIDVLSRNPLPSTRKLSTLRDPQAGPNKHWLSRLPARAKKQKYRVRLIAYLQDALKRFPE